MRRGGMLGGIFTIGAVFWGIIMFARSRNKGPMGKARYLLNRGMNGMNMINISKVMRMTRKLTRNFAR